MSQHQNEEEDKTNWKGWYWGLVLFLALQIILFIFITKSFEG